MEVCSALHTISLSRHMIQGSIPVFCSKGQKVSIILQPSSLRRKNAVFVRKTAKSHEKHIVFHGFCSGQHFYPLIMVEATGFEPTTSASRTLRATNCATPRHRHLSFQEERARFRAPLSSFGGDNEIRTRGLYVANVPLYQLSHIPIAFVL